MDTWNYWRSLARIDVGGARLPLDRLIRVWGAVAEWTRREKPTRVVHRAELKRKLVAILVERESGEDDPQATAESYLNAAADRVGLLEERGRDIFAFWHPTSKAIERLLPLRNNPRWREVILLAVGYVGIVQRDTDTATEIVEAIAEREATPMESLLHRHLRLAATCIADDVGVKRTLAQQIIVRLAHIIQAYPYEPLTASFVQTVHALPRLHPSAETVTALEPLSSYQNWEIRMEAARLLSNAASNNGYARVLCEQLLNDRASEVRCHAALGLARAGDYSPEVWRALAYFPSRYAYIEPFAREFFSAVSDEGFAALQSCLTAEEFWSRLHATGLLKRMGQGDLAVEPMARMVCPQPWTAVAACQRVMNGKALTYDDTEALAELVRVQEGYSQEQRNAQAWLFDWLWHRLESA